MGRREDRVLSGVLLADEIRLSVQEICTTCGVARETLVEMVTEGVVEPVELSSGEWRFGGATVARIGVVRRLQRDLGVNLSGAALALELLEEIERLRRLCRRLGAD